MDSGLIFEQALVEFIKELDLQIPMPIVGKQGATGGRS